MPYVILLDKNDELWGIPILMTAPLPAVFSAPDVENVDLWRTANECEEFPRRLFTPRRECLPLMDRGCLAFVYREVA